MFKKFRCAIDHGLVSLKLQVKHNRYLLIALLVAAAVGVIFAISACMQKELFSTTNIVILIQTESFSFFGFMLQLLLYYLVFAVLLFMAACHFYLLCLSFAGITAVSFMFWKSVFCSIAVDGFVGVIMMLFYAIPIAIVYLFTYFLGLKDIYPMVGYDCNRKRFSNINYYKKPVLKRIFKLLIINFAVVLLLTLLVAVFALIF